MKNKIPIIIKQFNPLSIYHGYQEETNTYNYEIRIEFTDSYFTKPVIMKMMEVLKLCIHRKPV